MSVFFVKYKWLMLVILLLLIAMSALGVLSPYIGSAFYYDECSPPTAASTVRYCSCSR